MGTNIGARRVYAVVSEFAMLLTRYISGIYRKSFGNFFSLLLLAQGGANNLGQRFILVVYTSIKATTEFCVYWRRARMKIYVDNYEGTKRAEEHPRAPASRTGSGSRKTSLPMRGMTKWSLSF